MCFMEDSLPQLMKGSHANTPTYIMNQRELSST